MKTKTEDDNTNNHFLLDCMGALMAASIIAAGVVAAYALKASTVVAAGMAASALLTTSASFVLFFPAIIPIAAISIALLAICLLPCMFSNSTYVSSPSYGYVGGFGNYHSGYYPGVYQPRFYESYPTGGVTHVHSSPVVHGHDGGGYHGHPGPGPGNMHGHR